MKNRAHQNASLIRRKASLIRKNISLIRRKASLISIVIPFYNEEENVEELYKRLFETFSKEKKYNFEIVAVEHGSVDSTFEKLLYLRKKDKRLKILQLSKNFGNVDAALLAGLSVSSGNAVITMMGDLQEPPETISTFLRKWEQGYEIIYGVIKKRADISKLRHFNSVLFYKILRLMIGKHFPENASDFRLIDKKVSEEINAMSERNIFLKGMILWAGFKQVGIPYERNQRYAGTSKADFLTVLKVASNAIFSFSYIPLRIVSFFGLTLSLLSFVIIIYEITSVIIHGREVPGLLSVIVLISFLFGILFIILGIIGEYLARIYDEAKHRPIYIIKEKIGFNSK